MIFGAGRAAEDLLVVIGRLISVLGMVRVAIYLPPTPIAEREDATIPLLSLTRKAARLKTEPGITTKLPTTPGS